MMERLINTINGNKRQSPLIKYDEYWIQLCNVPGYQHIKSIYWVSNQGRVYSQFAGYLTITYSFDYAYVQVYDISNKGNRIRVHRLVLLAFNYIPGCEQMEVNHKDGNKANNILDNLEWTTRVENMKHAVHSGLAASCEDSYRATVTNEQVHDICKLLCNGEYSSLEISKILHVSYFVAKGISSRQSWLEISKNYVFERKVSRAFTNAELRILLDFIQYNDINKYEVKRRYYESMLESIGKNTSVKSNRTVLVGIIENPDKYYDMLNKCRY